MKFKPIVIVAGEPNSIFSEIFLKTINKNKFRSPIILICSKDLLLKQSKLLNHKIKFNEIDKKTALLKNYKFKKINLINVNFKQSKAFEKISTKSNKYINECFKIGLDLMKNKVSNKFINGPISKETFLKKKFNGITEYLAHKTKTKNFAMIIYNKKLSVSPITTHIPIKYVAKKINKKKIIDTINLISNFWRKKFKKTAKIGITGLNPHCESISEYNEDKSIVFPAIQSLKKNSIKINGPFSADTIFLNRNRKKFNIIVGMYHDQVLTPIKTLFEYDAINITLGLPFIRVSPDHGPNKNMLGKNSSNILSMLNSIRFLDN